MPASNRAMIKKLQGAINNKIKEVGGTPLLYNTTQFFSEQQQRPITMYVVRTVLWDDKRNRNHYIELFKSTSQIQIVLYLRDYWFKLNDWELPTDNETWNEIREKIRQSEEEQDG